MKFIFLIGVPGSGKTFLGNQLVEQMDGLFLDDICRTCGRERLKESFDTEVVIIADPSLCHSINRFYAKAMIEEYHPNSEIEWIFFENDPEQCWKNVKDRNDGRVISRHSIRDLSRVYKIPENVEAIKVFRK